MAANENKKPYVFISYAHADKDRVLPIIEGLEKRGLRTWYDKGIDAGNEWPDLIAEQLENSSCVLSLVSRNFGESLNCRQEFSFAQDLRKNNNVVYLDEPKSLRAGLRMQMSSLHALNYDRYDTLDEFLDTLSKANVLKPCLDASAVPEPAVPDGSPLENAVTSEQEKTMEQGAEELYKRAEEHCAEMGYDKAVPLFRKAAEQGHADAQYSLGVCYERGEGVPMNFIEAVKWYHKAAEQGNAMAQNRLGECYYYGNGVAKKPEEAVKWYRRAAEQGNVTAQSNMGFCYEYGYGMPQNFEEAVKWYHKAADQGDANAQNSLAACYLKGRGVSPDKAEAIKWFRKAAEQGDAYSAARLKVLE